MTKNKILLVATVQSHIAQFHKPLIDILNQKGYEIHVAARNNLNEKNGLKIQGVKKIYDIPFSRSPLSKSNIKAFKQLKEVIDENKYDVIHCNTPIGGIITRLIGIKARKLGTKIIYTAHGFHFYKGAPFKNWLIYYPIEKLFSKYTDVLITINEEDYEYAKKKMKSNNIEHIHGVGMETERLDIELENVETIRKKYNIDKDAIILTYIAELNKNKNQEFLIDAVKKLKDKGIKTNLLLLGNGPLKNHYIELIQKKYLQEYVKLLGYNRNIAEVLKITDIYVASSKREGLPINIMEAMYMEKPIIANSNRGHRELVKDKKGGYIVNDLKDIVGKIAILSKDNELRENYGRYNKKYVGNYLEKKVKVEINKIYEGIEG